MTAIPAWLRRTWLHLHWRNLRKIASSKVIQSAAVFPFIGYFVIINDYWKSFFEVPGPLKHFSWLEPQSKLFLVYLGLFFIGLAVVVYNMRCPFLIKQFENEESCARFYMQMANYTQVYSMLMALFGEPDESPNPVHREISNRYGEFSRDPEAWQKFVSSRREEIFQFYVQWYSSGDRERLGSILTCFILFAFGLIFLAIPSLETLLPSPDRCSRQYDISLIFHTEPILASAVVLAVHGCVGPKLALFVIPHRQRGMPPRAPRRRGRAPPAARCRPMSFSISMVGCRDGGLCLRS
jgi:hypothetical protein